MYFGLDVGTSYLVSAKEESGKILYNKVRDAYYVVNLKTGLGINPLEVAGINYINIGDNAYLIGEDAIRFAVGQNDIARRPMRNGLISDVDLEAETMLIELFKSITKDIPQGSVVKYTVPAQLINSDESVIVHQESISDILLGLGFKPSPINEASCVVLSELASIKFTGLAASFGGGLINVTVCNMGQPVQELTFSILGSGDKIDQIVSNSLKGLGVKQSYVTLIKEKMSKAGRGIYNPAGNTDKDKRIEKAISMAYKSIIDNFTLSLEMVLNKSSIDFIDSLPFIIAGGTSLIPGFVDYVKESLSKRKFNINLEDPILSQDPLSTVAKGALVAAKLAYRSANSNDGNTK